MLSTVNIECAFCCTAFLKTLNLVTFFLGILNTVTDDIREDVASLLIHVDANLTLLFHTSMAVYHKVSFVHPESRLFITLFLELRCYPADILIVPLTGSTG
jgi:hypothetical protein